MSAAPKKPKSMFPFGYGFDTGSSPDDPGAQSDRPKMSDEALEKACGEENTEELSGCKMGDED